MADAYVWAALYAQRMSTDVRSGKGSRVLFGAAKESEAAEFAERAVRHWRRCLGVNFEIAEDRPIAGFADAGGIAFTEAAQVPQDPGGVTDGDPQDPEGDPIWDDAKVSDAGDVLNMAGQ